MINIRNSIGQKSYHIVDINDENHSLWFACKQSKYPQNYYGEGNGNALSAQKGWSDKELQWENGTKTEILKKLSEKFKRKVIVLDATKKDLDKPKNKGMFAIFLEGKNRCRETFGDVLTRCNENNQEPIILLWRGNRWQAVLPD